MKFADFTFSKENKGLLGVAFLTSSISFFISVYLIADSITQAVLKYSQKSNVNISGGHIYNPLPEILFYLFTFSIFFALWKIKNYIISIFFTFIPFSIFTYEFYIAFQYVELNEFFSGIALMNGFQFIMAIFHLLLLFLLTILLFWQSLILLRMLIKNTQRKNVLP
jgi:hypothetical protein